MLRLQSRNLLESDIQYQYVSVFVSMYHVSVLVSISQYISVCIKGQLTTFWVSMKIFHKLASYKAISSSCQNLPMISWHCIICHVVVLSRTQDIAKRLLFSHISTCCSPCITMSACWYLLISFEIVPSVDKYMYIPHI